MVLESIINISLNQASFDHVKVFVIPSPDQPPHDLTWPILFRKPKCKFFYVFLLKANN